MCLFLCIINFCKANTMYFAKKIDNTAIVKKQLQTQSLLKSCLHFISICSQNECVEGYYPFNKQASCIFPFVNFYIFVIFPEIADAVLFVSSSRHRTTIKRNGEEARLKLFDNINPTLQTTSSNGHIKPRLECLCVYY